MSTTLTFNGTTFTFDNPKDLRAKGAGAPGPQPIASWATQLTAFQQMCTDGLYADAIRYLAAEYVTALLTDVPSGVRTAFKAYVQSTYGNSGAPVLPAVL